MQLTSFPILAVYVPHPEQLVEDMVTLGIVYTFLCFVAFRMNLSMKVVPILMLLGACAAVSFDVLHALNADLGDYGDLAREQSNTNLSDGFFAVTAYFCVGRGKPLAFTGMAASILAIAAVTIRSRQRDQQAKQQDNGAQSA